MQISVVFRHMDPSDGVRPRVQARLSRRHRADAAPSARTIAVAGVEETEDMYAAIDLVVHRLDRRIDRRIDQTRQRRREPGRSAEA